MAQPGHLVSYLSCSSPAWERARCSVRSRSFDRAHLSVRNVFFRSPLAVSPRCSASIPCFLFAVARRHLNVRRVVPIRTTPCRLLFRRPSSHSSTLARAPRPFFRNRSDEHSGVRPRPFFHSPARGFFDGFPFETFDPSASALATPPAAFQDVLGALPGLRSRATRARNVRAKRSRRSTNCTSTCSRHLSSLGTS